MAKNELHHNITIIYLKSQTISVSCLQNCMLDFTYSLTILTLINCHKPHF